MEKNYNYNFEQRTPYSKPTVETITVNLTECKKETLADIAISNGNFYHTTDTNDFYYDWNDTRYKLDLFGSTTILEGLDEAIEKATNAERIANENKTRLDGIKTIKTFAATTTGYDLTLSDGSILRLKNGNDGIIGADGADGKSAYEIAVEKGFNGTEDAWIASLKGNDGIKGDDGIDGADGKSAYEIALANGFEGTEDAWIASLKGNDGATPVIDPDTKHWIINGADSGIVAEGRDGTDVDLSGKLDVLPLVDDPDDPGNGWPYHIPYNVIPAVDANGMTLTIKTITLDNNVTKWDNTMSLPSATIETAGLMSAADKVKVESIPENFGSGEFPDDETPDATKNGFATVQDVMDYVKLMLEKKKLDDYLYVNGYLDGETPNDITIYNPYAIVLDDENKFEIEVISPAEMEGYPGNYKAVTFGVDVPDGYTLESLKQWVQIGSGAWYDVDYDQNPRGNKKYGDVSYNCWSRKPADGDWETVDAELPAGYRYKITISKD